MVEATATSGDDDEPEPTPAAAPEPEAPAADGPAPTVEAVDAAWPAIMARVRDEAGMRRHALFREARPAAMEGSRLILELPAHLPFHLAQLGEDDRLNAVVIAAASDALGTSITLAYRSADGDPSLAEPADAGTEEAAVEAEPERAPDKEQLVEASESEIDPTGLVIDLLGGEVIDE